VSGREKGREIKIERGEQEEEREGKRRETEEGEGGGGGGRRRQTRPPNKMKPNKQEAHDRRARLRDTL
jgi:hypothetical protein